MRCSRSDSGMGGPARPACGTLTYVAALQNRDDGVSRGKQAVPVCIHPLSNVPGLALFGEYRIVACRSQTSHKLLLTRIGLAACASQGVVREAETMNIIKQIMHSTAPAHGKEICRVGRHTKSASAESMALHATMTALRVKHAAQIAVTQPTSRSFLRLPRDSIGNLQRTAVSSHRYRIHLHASGIDRYAGKISPCQKESGHQPQ